MVVVDGVSKKVAGALRTRAVKSSGQAPSKKFDLDRSSLRELHDSFPPL
jgi:hypothetical protein